MSNTATPSVLSAPPELTSTKIGIVVSDACSKTRIVAVEGYFVHPKYGKRIAQESRFHVHDEANVSKKGDRVEIVPCRPMSKTKRFRVVRVTQKSAVSDIVVA